MSKKHILIISVCLLFLTGCGEYSRVMKSKDLNYKFEYAKKAYAEGKYVQASTMIK